MNEWMKPRPYWCVYAHFLGERVIYVGCGGPKRPRQVSPSSRNRLWHRFIADSSKITVVVFRRFRSFLAAEHYERRKIRELKPPANIKDNPEVFGQMLRERRIEKLGLVKHVEYRRAGR